MTNKTVDLIASLEDNEVDFYAKLVPNLLTELTTSRRLLRTSQLEHSKTKETLDKVYKDYQASHSKQYHLIKSIKTWKMVSLGLAAGLVTFLILGAI
jgi:hypothetical protein